MSADDVPAAQAGSFLDLRRFLARPGFYRLFRNLLFGKRGRQVLLDEFIRAKAGDRLIDIGCGPGVMLDDLPEVDYVGIDIEERYITRARRLYGRRGRFLLGTAGLDGIDLRGDRDIALAIGVLHHLTDDEARGLLAAARKALRAGGRLITFDNCYTPDQSRFARLVIDLDRGQFVRTREAYEGLIAEVFPRRRVVVRHDLLRIPYTHIICEASGERPEPR